MDPVVHQWSNVRVADHGNGGWCEAPGDAWERAEGTVSLVIYYLTMATGFEATWK